MNPKKYYKILCGLDVILRKNLLSLKESLKINTSLEMDFVKEEIGTSYLHLIPHYLHQSHLQGLGDRQVNPDKK